MVSASNLTPQVPVRLFVGGVDVVRSRITQEVQDFLVLSPTSPAYDSVSAGTHPSMRWIMPEEGSSYKRSDLEILFEEVYRVRDSKAPVFFIFPSAELLSESCANSLLKMFEEPPQHTYFFLGATCTDFVLSTIVSRSLVVLVGKGEREKTSPLIPLFTGRVPLIPHAQFSKMLEEEEVDERTSRMLMDAIFEELQMDFRRAIETDDADRIKRAERGLKVISYGFDRLPMPGSAKYFWRTLYLFMK